jgi:hypothetical protein
MSLSENMVAINDRMESKNVYSEQKCSSGSLPLGK